MPFYAAMTQDGSMSDETKAKVAEEIMRIHTAVMFQEASSEWSSVLIRGGRIYRW